MTELSRPLRIDQVPPGGCTVEVTASAAECAAIAHRLGVPRVAALGGRFVLHPEGGGVVRAAGHFAVRLERICVVSLDPFLAEQEEDFAVAFVPTGSESDADDPEATDQLPYEDGVIDLGEALVEQVALDLDPYPRRPGAELPAAGDAAQPSPFAALAALRRRT